jgi:hypothetical protein
MPLILLQTVSAVRVLRGVRTKVAETLQQSMAVSECLLGGRVGFALCSQVSEEPVSGGDNVFDLRAGPSFQNRQRVDEHGRVGDHLHGLLQLCKGCSGSDALLQDGFGLQIHCRWKRGKLVVWTVWLPLIDQDMSPKSNFRDTF